MTKCSGLDIYLCFLKCSDASFGEKLPAFRRSSVTSFSGSSRPHSLGCSIQKIRSQISFVTPVIIYEYTRRNISKEMTLDQELFVKVKSCQPQYLTNFTLEHFCYTGCNRRNGPDFGRVFLRSNYTDITQNTYIQS